MGIGSNTMSLFLVIKCEIVGSSRETHWHPFPPTGAHLASVSPMEVNGDGANGVRENLRFSKLFHLKFTNPIKTNFSKGREAAPNNQFWKSSTFTNPTRTSPHEAQLELGYR